VELGNQIWIYFTSRIILHIHRILSSNSGFFRIFGGFYWILLDFLSFFAKIHLPSTLYPTRSKLKGIPSTTFFLHHTLRFYQRFYCILAGILVDFSGILSVFLYLELRSCNSGRNWIGEIQEKDLFKVYRLRGEL